MRGYSLLTARQLASVSGRYRHDLCGLNASNRLLSAPRRWPAGRTESAGRAAEANPRGRDHRLQRLEAVLFCAREPLTSRKLSQYANLADGTEARTQVRRLNELYDASGRAFRVERVAGGYQLMTRRKLAGWVRRLAGVPRETRLSAPALETLAVIAYRQPILRAEIEGVRGVNCGEILRQLMDRDFVRIGGRSEELGRPYLYATTKQFLRVFGLDSLDDLPWREQLRRSGPASVVGPQPRGADDKSLDQGNVELKSREEKGSIMPVLTRSGQTWDKSEFDRAGEEIATPYLATAYEDEDDAFDEDEDEDEGDDDDEADEEEDDEDFDDDLEDEWEEVEENGDEEDDEEWDEEEDDDDEWDYDDEDDETEEGGDDEEEDDWDDD